MKKSLPVAVAVLGAAATAGGAPATSLAATKAASKKYTGATTSFKYGRMDVTIVVSDKKISTISVTYSPTDPRSSQIDASSLPTLRKEALKKQGWDVHSVSGASYTSAAFRTSMHSAMGHADLLKK